MISHSPESIRKHFAACAGKIEDFSSALDTLFAITSDMGFTQVLYAYLPTPARLPNGDWLPLKLNVRNFPRDWEGEWKQYMRVDPYYRACFQGIMPLEWAEVQSSEWLTEKQRKACAYLGDFGLWRGVTVPVHLPFGRFAVVSAIVDSSCRNWEHVRDNAWEPLRALTHDFTQLVLERGLENQIERETHVQLTPREIECLRWASAGKTSHETAIIIGRSVETVRLHLKNAMRKLDACNRVQAVATAAQLGLL
ncbi:helix-turn-helix transcriptional regulator [Camelimonas abortus]|uniref:Helix-turn-helix transcriptional regulator n=1 Tax=Camelimonas abortus TaxID=1017184 RepID=A0ABV7LGP0_9HYPH